MAYIRSIKSVLKMNRVFKIEHREKEEIDALKHTQSILDKYGDSVQIFVGCDSQNKSKKARDKEGRCIYATVIAYRFNYGDSGARSGASYIYHREEVAKTKDKFTRLWGEVERSVEVAKWLEENGFKVYQIDLDFNQKSNTGSHDMVAASTGFVVGQGFRCSTKPELQMSSRAADHIVKKRSKKNRVHYKKKSKVK